MATLAGFACVQLSTEMVIYYFLHIFLCKHLLYLNRFYLILKAFLYLKQFNSQRMHELYTLNAM